MAPSVPCRRAAIGDPTCCTYKMPSPESSSGITFRSEKRDVGIVGRPERVDGAFGSLQARRDRRPDMLHIQDAFAGIFVGHHVRQHAAVCGECQMADLTGHWNTEFHAFGCDLWTRRKEASRRYCPNSSAGLAP